MSDIPILDNNRSEMTGLNRGRGRRNVSTGPVTESTYARIAENQEELMKLHMQTEGDTASTYARIAKNQAETSKPSNPGTQIGKSVAQIAREDNYRNWVLTGGYRNPGR